MAELGDALEIDYVMVRPPDAPPPARAVAWLDAGAQSGMPVDPRGLLEDPPTALHPPALAVKAVAEQGDPGPFLRRVREAIFVERRRLDRGDALLDVARETRPAPRVDQLRVAFGSSGIVEALAADLERSAGVAAPALRFGDQAPLSAREPYERWREAAAWAGAAPADVPRPPSVEEALRRFGTMATPEVAAVCDLPGPRAAAELWRLALEWRVRARRVLGGELWELA
jgi:hypothetical protein